MLFLMDATIPPQGGKNAREGETMDLHENHRYNQF
jgi:hypothetical protein